MHIPIFLVFYNTTFTILLLALIGLLLISPADAIYQSLQNNQPANVIIVAGAYLLTLLVAGFFYATRLYATRTHLASLPRSARVPEALAGAAVRRVVRAGLARAAAIAYAAHPRDLIAERNANGGRAPPPPPELFAPGKEPSAVATEAGENALNPAFGVIQHPGWTAPSTADLPGVHFPSVIAELPHLLEAKAVSLAPPDLLAGPPSSSQQGSVDPGTGNAASLPDPFAVAALQRPAFMDVRAYVAHLDSLEAVTDIPAAASFVKQYEYARFSGMVLDEDAFRQLMITFAALLRSLKCPDPDLLRDFANLSASSDTTSTAPPSLAGSALPSLHSQPSIQAFRQERPAIPKRGHTTGSAAAILDRLAAQEPSVRINQSATSRRPTSYPSAVPTSTFQSSTQSPAASTPLPATPTPHHTPFFTPYRTSVSSNDGDRSADSSDAGLSSGADEDQARAATGDRASRRLRRRRSRRPTPVRRSTHSSLARTRHGRGLGLEMTRAEDLSHSHSTEEAAFMSFASDESEDEDDGGSVIRRVVTAQEVTRDSASEAGSVVIRPEDHGLGGLLPVPVAVESGNADDARGEAEMRMVEGGT